MFVEMSKNILDHESKVVGNFSTREAVCGGLGCIVAFVIGFHVTNNSMEINTRIMLSIICAMPFFAVGFAKIYDMPLEQILPILIIDNIIYPRNRFYDTRFDEINDMIKEASSEQTSEQSDDMPDKKQKTKRKGKKAAKAAAKPITKVSQVKKSHKLTAYR